jgi:hypothetical protein
MFKREPHEHTYRVHSIGAGLARAICDECHHISIRVFEELPEGDTLGDVRVFAGAVAALASG